MAVWSSLKYAVVASCAVGLTQVQALPAASPSAGMTEWGMADRHDLYSRQQNDVITSGARRTVAPRKEIRQIINNADRSEFHLLLLALRKMQTMRSSDPLSYYQIAGIHGRPYLPWAGVASVRGGNPNSGYCTHADVLFLPWHRPYLSLFEQSLWNNARDVVEEIRAAGNADLATRYANVLEGIRLPYWDWAFDASVPREVGEMPNIQVQTQRGLETIPNPLYSYRFQNGEIREIGGGAPFNAMSETYRWPNRVGNGYVSQGAALNNAMRRLGGDLRNRSYRLLSYPDFNTVGTRVTPPGQQARDSLEGVHDTVHGTTGSGGHMSFVDNAAFDPIFWLHHANMDRLFAIWQVANPNQYNRLSGTSPGTYSIPRGTPENMNLQMPPFRASQNSYHTPAGVTNTETFGYTYPETRSQNARDAITAFNRLYAPGTPSGNLNTAVRAAKHKRSLGLALKKRQDVKPSENLNTPPSPDALETVQDKIVENKKFQDWESEIKVNNNALKSSFNIHIFLGEVPSDSKTWASDKNLVGTHSIITSVDGGHMESIVGGIVPLTSCLLNKVITGDIKDLDAATVVPYLKANLKVRISMPDGGSSDIKKVDKLTVQVAVASVTLPDSQDQLPKYGNYEVQFDAVDVAKGNFGQ
ncbi:hypothetical protein TWF718_003493 [Orbilia javanica]|uniref:tyrosinase n=1 Tax=Orbilia javanica TaxID=47235 RepID=A0AAN8MLA5_9PEZI